MLMLMGQVKRMLCLMYGNCPSHRLDNMKEKALKRKVCTSRSYSDGNVKRMQIFRLYWTAIKKEIYRVFQKKLLTEILRVVFGNQVLGQSGPD